MQHRRTGVFIGCACLITLAACGSGSDGAALPIADAPSIAADAVPDDFSEQAASPGTDTESGDASSGAAETTDDSIELEGEQPVVDEEEIETPPVVEQAPSEPALGGRLFAPDVEPAAQFDGNPFPDLVVEDIGRDAQVNIKNILPSDRPVLLWAWAPH